MGKQARRGHESRLVRWCGVFTTVSVLACGCGGTTSASGAPGAGASSPTSLDGGLDRSLDGGLDALAPPVPFVTPPDTGDDSGPGTVTVDDAAAALDPNATYSVTLTTDTFTVPPNSEVYKCQDFANPFDGQAVDINRYDLEMTQGSHHMLLFYSPDATDGPLIDCPQGGLQTGPYTFGAQSPKATQTYPDGVGAAIPAGMGFTVNAHYVNTGPTTLQGQVTVTMFVARPGITTQHAGVLSFILTSISDPAQRPALPRERDVLDSHGRERALDGRPHAPGRDAVRRNVGLDHPVPDHQWSEPPSMAFSPPLQLAANSNVTWTCTYVNDTGDTLTFGESALTNAMCNFSATFFPVQDPTNPVVQCLQ